MLIEQIKKDMIVAMKAKDIENKETLSLLLSNLQKAQKDKNTILSEIEEIEIIKKEVKQTKETLLSCPEDRKDIIDKCINRITLLSQYIPKELEEYEIRGYVVQVLDKLKLGKELNIKHKGAIMKELMPLVKGKADGKLVNKVVEEILNGKD